MSPSARIDEYLQPALHHVGGLLGNHAPQGVGDEHAQHVALLFQAALHALELHSCRGHEEGEAFSPPDLSGNDSAHAERAPLHVERVVHRVHRSAIRHDEAEVRTENPSHLIPYRLNLLPDVVRGRVVAVAHLHEEFAVGDVEVVIRESFFKHIPVVDFLFPANLSLFLHLA